MVISFARSVRFAAERPPWRSGIVMRTPATPLVVDAGTATSVVVIAASVGGIAALSTVLGDLPRDLPAAVVVVQHLMPNVRSRIAEILRERTSLPVRSACEDDVLRRGVVYVAPPGRHLLITPAARLTLSDSAPVDFVRPSASLLFESAAAAFGSRTVAVVLTGRGSDGLTGVIAVKRAGGIVIAQDEATSASFGMPGAVIQSGKADHVLPLGRIAPRLTTLLERETRV
jgi:two-component system chemotaxis response regulator CheB